MSEKNRHIKHLNHQDDDFFSKGKIVWEKSEADVWSELERKISKNPAGKTVSLYSGILKWTAAAVIFILIGFGSFAFLYTKSIESVPGDRLVAELPDGSTVALNAGSVLKYYPFKWNFQRKVHFEGEGFFEVQKGKKFEVESANGITRVLGTSFNIYARNNQYRVTCLTGKVEVLSRENESAILTPNMHVELEKNKLVLKNLFKAEKAVSWKRNEFFFSGRPLKEVIEEIERQYAVKIHLQPEIENRTFVSNFSKKDNVEEVLTIVCKTMKLKFEKQAENVFLVLK